MSENTDPIVVGGYVTISQDMYNYEMRKREALASALQKFLLNDNAYVDLDYNDSACFDGWVGELTSDEIEAMRSVRKEVRPDV